MDNEQLTILVIIFGVYSILITLLFIFLVCFLYIKKKKKQKRCKYQSTRLQEQVAGSPPIAATDQPTPDPNHTALVSAPVSVPVHSGSFQSLEDDSEEQQIWPSAGKSKSCSEPTLRSEYFSVKSVSSVAEFDDSVAQSPHNLLRSYRETRLTSESSSCTEFFDVKMFEHSGSYSQEHSGSHQGAFVSEKDQVYHVSRIGSPISEFSDVNYNNCPPNEDRRGLQLIMAKTDEEEEEEEEESLESEPSIKMDPKLAENYRKRSSYQNFGESSTPSDQTSSDSSDDSILQKPPQNESTSDCDTQPVPCREESPVQGPAPEPKRRLMRLRSSYSSVSSHSDMDLKVNYSDSSDHDDNEGALPMEHFEAAPEHYPPPEAGSFCSSSSSSNCPSEDSDTRHLDAEAEANGGWQLVNWQPVVNSPLDIKDHEAMLRSMNQNYQPVYSVASSKMSVYSSQASLTESSQSGDAPEQCIPIDQSPEVQ